MPPERLEALLDSPLETTPPGAGAGRASPVPALEFPEAIRLCTELGALPHDPPEGAVLELPPEPLELLEELPLEPPDDVPPPEDPDEPDEEEEPPLEVR